MRTIGIVLIALSVASIPVLWLESIGREDYAWMLVFSILLSTIIINPAVVQSGVNSLRGSLV